MAGRGRVPVRRGPPRPAPVPFLLAAARDPRAARAPGARSARREERLERLWARLGPLEEAAWRGRLGARALARLQRLRVAYLAALEAERG